MKIREFKDKKLSLKNDGKLELFFLGTGSAFTKKNYQTNLLIVKGEDHLLIDCGTKCTQALYDLGLSIVEIDKFLITHSHADHIGGLEEAMLMNRYFAKKKGTMVITETYQNILWDMSLSGGCEFSEEKEGVFLTFGDFWKVVRPKWLEKFPRETFEVNVGGINIKMFRTKHVPDSAPNWDMSVWTCGIIIDDKVMFTSDTRYDRDLLESYDAIFHFEQIFHDCQLFTGGVHASLEELKELPAALKKKMTLVHYSDEWEKYIGKVEEYGFNGFGKKHQFYTF